MGDIQGLGSKGFIGDTWFQDLWFRVQLRALGFTVFCIEGIGFRVPGLGLLTFAMA